MEFLDRTRSGYDSAATEFAEMVRGTGNLTVADVGCGSGVTTRMLDRLGVVTTGVDLSPKMIDEARSRAPHLRL